MQADPAPLLTRPASPLAGLDIAKHVLALAVIVQHMPSATRYSADTNAHLGQISHYIDGAVCGFFLISGFLFRMPVDPKRYVRNRVVRLLVPFALFAVVYAIALHAMGKPGFGPQLYFLPYLLITSLGYLGFCLAIRRTAFARFGDVFALIVLILLSQLWPTTDATGPDPRLLLVYGAAYLAGRIVQEAGLLRGGLPVLIALSAMGALGDDRYLSVALAFGCVAVFLLISHRLPAHRLPGSGGVYLLHTPLVNFALSAALYRLGVYEGSNVVLSVAATYLVCLAFTLLFLRWMPERRWLLLE